jgi:hypothetical protein
MGLTTTDNKYMSETKAEQNSSEVSFLSEGLPIIIGGIAFFITFAILRMYLEIGEGTLVHLSISIAVGCVFYIICENNIANRVWALLGAIAFLIIGYFFT